MQIAVLGAGSWGTALALVLARNNHNVHLWGHNPKQLEQIQKDRCNTQYLPDIPIPSNLVPQPDLSEAIRGCSLVVIAVPSHAFRELLERLPSCLKSPCGIAWATKGLELKTGLPLHHVVKSVLGDTFPAAILSGPTFAGEVARGQPTAITVASESESFASELVSIFHNPKFRAYTTTDVVGVELGGAVKNVLAIAAGVADGLGYGANARAALITRGLAELMRLGLTLGGRPETLMGLSGVGDLILTCTDNQSRNRRFGLGLGKGLAAEEIATQIGQEIEGIPTARIVHELSIRHRIEMPITEQVYRILYEGLPPHEAVSNLLVREPKPENDPPDPT
ncbi:MAG TPA: glycerol-3-phosphate dehydrogenase [Methylococcaceae bacterium]|nr:glycerol-3-phosphate dehydrogenase [Methylococcaceae bacterium]